VCLCPIDSEVKSRVDIGSSVEIVDEFCYLEGMMSVDRDAAAAVKVRICSGWFRFRSMACSFTVKDASLLLQGKVFDACMRMLHGSQTWSLTRENELPLHRAKMRMIRWMCGVKLRDKLSCVELSQQLGIEDIVKWTREIECNLVLRKDGDDDWVKMCYFGG